MKARKARTFVRKKDPGRPRAAASRRRSVSLVHVTTSTVRIVSEAEARLSQLLTRLATLNTERDELAAALSEFEEREAEHLDDVTAALLRAQQVARRLERLDEELRAPRVVRTGRRRAAPAERKRVAPRSNDDWFTAAPSSLPPPPEPEWDLKAFYRKLARRLHPDTAVNEAERTRRSRLMLRLNEAFAAGDRVRLELIAGEIGGDDENGADAPVDADARMEQRARELAPLLDRLERDLRRSKSTAAHRRFDEARSYEGEDYFAAVRERTLAQARTVRVTFAGRAARVEEATRALNARFVPKARSGEKSGGSPLAALDPPLPFRDAVEGPAEWSGASGVFASKLRALAREVPWKAAWVIAAIFAEIAGRPPARLATMAAWSEWHETLRAGKRGVPPFEEALTDLPALLELGCRVHPDGVRFGVLLKDPDPAAFAPGVMAEAPVASIAADLLTALSPRAVCPACARAVPLVHVQRLRDVDPLHAMVCSRCGEVVEKYRAVGRLEGLEALGPYAAAVGLSAEVAVSFGETVFRLGLLRKERARLTSERLGRLFSEATLLGDAATAARRRLVVSAGGEVLAKTARVPFDEAVRIAFRGKGPSEKAVVHAMRLRAKKRFERS